MQRRVLLSLAVLLTIPAIAQAAIVITAGVHPLLANTAGQKININLKANGEFYTDGNMRLLIAAGGPVITHVFNDTDAGIPVANLAGSIWAGSAFTGIAGTPDGTSPTDSGRRTSGSFLTAAGPQSTDGIFATLTLSTVGIAAGTYSFSLTAHPNGATDLFNGLDGNDEPIPTNLQLVNGSFTIPIPEPGSIVLGLFAVAGLATVAIRRHRGRRAA